MSLIDFGPPPDEDQIMDPATKQYVDSSHAVAEARSDTKLAEFRTVIEAYTARADEREAAAQERERTADVERRISSFEATVSSVKRTIIMAALSVILGVGALNAALFYGVRSMFDAGRQFAGVQAEMQRQLTEMAVVNAQVAEAVRRMQHPEPDKK